ncbi:hypothetical protein GP2_054_00280, partial [Gordonia paraffinivorans NBRC 108238]
PLKKAAANHIHVALSSPCIELWFFLHYENQTAFLHRHDAQAKSKKCMGCDKHLSQDALTFLLDSYESAANRARALARKHVGDMSPVPWNPYSNMWELIETIRRGRGIDNTGRPFNESS